MIRLCPALDRVARRLNTKTEVGLVTRLNLKRLANRHGTARLQQALASGPRHGPAGLLVQPSRTTAAGGCRHLSMPEHCPMARRLRRFSHGPIILPLPSSPHPALSVVQSSVTYFRNQTV